MDYDEYFRSIQSVLIHCNNFVKKFDKIVSYGGKKMLFYKIYQITINKTNYFRK